MKKKNNKYKDSFKFCLKLILLFFTVSISTYLFSILPKKIINSKKTNNIQYKYKKNNIPDKIDTLFKYAQESSKLRKASIKKNNLSKQNKIPLILFLGYQNISDSKFVHLDSSPSLSINSKTLNNDLSKLKKRGYISISLQTWHNHLYHKNKLPQNCVIICFIGGLTEHYQFAFNALKQNNLKGTFFVPSLKKSKNKHSLMNPFMIKELDLNGMEIGVYIDSENLKHLSSLIEIKNELQEIVNQKIRFISSKNKIEKFKIKYSKVGFAGSINFFSFFSQPIQKKIIKSFFISNNY